MAFTQLEFLILLIATVVAVWSLDWFGIRRGSPPGGSGASNRYRQFVLLLVSYYFYAYWDIRFCVLLAASTLIDYLIAQRIAAAASVSVVHRWLVVSLCSNLGTLGFFKYFSFFVDSAAPIFAAAGIDPPALRVILPVGISFFTFQTLSYTVDVYRGKLRPANSLLTFALYVAFFPQLVAGPIVRASELMPQLVSAPRWSNGRFYRGMVQFLIGAVKKVLMADRLAEMVDVVFAGPELYGGGTIAIAVIAYAGQIYYDFSGYTDMAIGIAKMLGYRFPKNFRHPYLATSLAEFWHRWHITLSRWLRDYLYIPLGGSRTTQSKVYRNLLITMTLGGLWHGAAWTFVLWGIWHGVALSMERAFSTAIKLPRGLGWLLTMATVSFGWILFRCESLSDVSIIVRRMLTLADGIDWFPPLPLIAITLMVAEHLLYRTRGRWLMRLPANNWSTPVVVAILLWSLLCCAPQGFRPFVYFQF